MKEKKPFCVEFLELGNKGNGSEVVKVASSGLLGEERDNGVFPGVRSVVGLESKIVGNELEVVGDESNLLGAAVFDDLTGQAVGSGRFSWSEVTN